MLGKCLFFILGEQLERVLLDRLLGREPAGEPDKGEGPVSAAAAEAVTMAGVMTLESFDCDGRLHSPRNSGIAGR